MRLLLVLAVIMTASCGPNLPSAYDIKKARANEAAWAQDASCDELASSLKKNGEILSREFDSQDAKNAGTWTSVGASLVSSVVSVPFAMIPFLGPALSGAGMVASDTMRTQEFETQWAYDAQFDAYTKKGCEPTLTYGQYPIE